MRAHRRINPAARAALAMHDVMQALAHPMQALKLVTLRVSAHIQHRCHSMRVVRGELRVNPVGHPEQFARIGQITRIRRLFPREHRE